MYDEVMKLYVYMFYLISILRDVNLGLNAIGPGPVRVKSLGQFQNEY